MKRADGVLLNVLAGESNAARKVMIRMSNHLVGHACIGGDYEAVKAISVTAIRNNIRAFNLRRRWQGVP